MKVVAVPDMHGDHATPRAVTQPPQDRGFAKQLLKAVVKKPARTDAAHTLAPANVQQPAQDPTQPTLGQIINSLVAIGKADVRSAVVKPIVGIAVAKPHVEMTGATPQIAATSEDIVKTLAGAVGKPDAATRARALTPLEQAVHDMLADLDKRASAIDDEPTGKAQLASFAPQASAPQASALEPDAPAPIAEVPAPMQRPQELVSQHHAHIVLDEPGMRVVMTVAVRGNDVNVNVRSSDDATAAALARNAGSLDEAMRAHKLDLQTFTADREHARDRDAPEQPKKQQQEPELSFDELVKVAS